MNWRHGFFRLWLVLAVLWWGAMAAHFVNKGEFDGRPKIKQWTTTQLHDVLKELLNAEKAAQAAGDQQAVEDTNRLAEIVDGLSNKHPNKVQIL